MNILTGLHKQDRGRILINGEENSSKIPKKPKMTGLLLFIRN